MKINCLKSMLVLFVSSIFLSLNAQTEGGEKILFKQNIKVDNGEEIERKGVITKDQKLVIKDSDGTIHEMNNNEELRVEQEEEVIIENGEKKVIKKIRIISLDENGKEKVMEWEGNENDEVPAEFAKHLKELESEDSEIIEKKSTKEVSVKVNQTEDGKKQVVIDILENGKKQLIEFISESDDIQSEIDQKLIDVGINDTSEKEVEIIIEEKEKSQKRGSLGVSIQDHEDGVFINGIVGNSAAELSGIEGGDIIQFVNEKKINTTKDLVAEIGSFYAGDSLKIKVLRGDQVLEKTATLKARIPRTWKEAIK